MNDSKVFKMARKGEVLKSPGSSRVLNSIRVPFGNSQQSHVGAPVPRVHRGSKSALPTKKPASDRRYPRKRSAVILQGAFITAPSNLAVWGAPVPKSGGFWASRCGHPIDHVQLTRTRCVPRFSLWLGRRHVKDKWLPSTVALTEPSAAPKKAFARGWR